MNESEKCAFSNYIVGLLPALVQTVQVEVTKWADMQVSQEALNAIIAARLVTVLLPPEKGIVA